MPGFPSALSSCLSEILRLAPDVLKTRRGLKGDKNPFNIYFCKTKYNAYKILTGLDRMADEAKMAERSGKDFELMQNMKGA